MIFIITFNITMNCTESTKITFKKILIPRKNYSYIATKYECATKNEYDKFIKLYESNINCTNKQLPLTLKLRYGLSNNEPFVNQSCIEYVN